MSDADALMWRIESDPVLRSPILVVGLLGADPPHAEVVEVFERAATLFPRLRQRVVSAGPLIGQLRWLDDPQFDIRHHLHERTLVPESGLRGVLDLAAEEAAAAFDPARPPWRAILARGFDDERAALVLRFHHSLTDGVGGVDLAHQLFQPLGSVADDVAEPPAPTLHRRPDLVDRALGLARVLGSTVADPVGAAHGSLRTARSVVRLLAPAKEPLSPLLDGRSIDRHLHVFDVPLEAFREAAAACDSTINDVFLGVVGGAVRAYHQHEGTPLHALRFTMPVNRRSAGDAPGGNRFTPVRFVLEVDGADLAERARRAGAISRGWKRDPSLGFTDLLAAALNRLPDQAVTAAFSGMLRSVDVDAVDVPGLADPVALAGAPLERLWAFAPPTGAALSVTLLSHLDRACVALECDTAAVHEPTRLAADLTNALDEVVDLAAGGTGGTP